VKDPKVLKPVSATELPELRMIYHRVVRGDTIIGLAKRYHVWVKDMKEWNNIKNSVIMLDQRLTLYVEPKNIPEGMRTYDLPADYKPPVPESEAVAVEEKETSSPDEKTPEAPVLSDVPAPSILETADFEPLESTSKADDVEIDADTSSMLKETEVVSMEAADTTDSQSILFETELAAPDATADSATDSEPETTASQEAPAKKPGPANTKEFNHVVSTGETLASIAGIYGVRASDVKDWNGIRDKTLVPGNSIVIYLPVSKTQAETSGAELLYEYYTVVRGDNLRRIAARFGTTQTMLVRINKLNNPNDVKVGQKLKIPMQ
jgi:LysM repeat protein